MDEIKMESVDMIARNIEKSPHWRYPEGVAFNRGKKYGVWENTESTFCKLFSKTRI